MKRSWDHWFDVGCQLIPSPEPNAYQRDAEGLWPTSKKRKTRSKPKDDESSLFELDE